MRQLEEIKAQVSSMLEQLYEWGETLEQTLEQTRSESVHEDLKKVRGLIQGLKRIGRGVRSVDMYKEDRGERYYALKILMEDNEHGESWPSVDDIQVFKSEERRNHYLGQLAAATGRTNSLAGFCNERTNFLWGSFVVNTEEIHIVKPPVTDDDDGFDEEDN